MLALTLLAFVVLASSSVSAAPPLRDCSAPCILDPKIHPLVHRDLVTDAMSTVNAHATNNRASAVRSTVGTQAARYSDSGFKRYLSKHTSRQIPTSDYQNENSGSETSARHPSKQNRSPRPASASEPGEVTVEQGNTNYARGLRATDYSGDDAHIEAAGPGPNA